MALTPDSTSTTRVYTSSASLPVTASPISALPVRAYLDDPPGMSSSGHGTGQGRLEMGEGQMGYGQAMSGWQVRTEVGV